MNTTQRKKLKDILRMFESAFYQTLKLSLTEEKGRPWWYLRATVKTGNNWPTEEAIAWRNQLEAFISTQGYGVGDGGGAGSNGEMDIWWWTQHTDDLMNAVADWMEKNQRGIPISFNTMLTFPTSEGPQGAPDAAYEKRYGSY